VTAAFTKNLFARMNRELGSRLDLETIEHIARYNERWQRIEIHAHFHEAQKVTVEPLGVDLDIGAGEEVMVEISRKFLLDDLTQYAQAFGLEVCETFTDERRWFAVLLLRRTT
jgi:L-histidine N-alpha-methyltransferase